MARRPRRALGDQQILPLINIVFLLLIAFMLMGQLVRSEPFELAPPRSNQGGEAGDAAVVILFDRAGRLALDGEPLAREALIATLAAALDAAPEASVRLEADGRAAAIEVVALLDALRAAGVTRVELVTEHVERRE